MIKTIKTFIKKLIFSFIKQPYKNIYSSYSQAGEDAIINFLFNDKGLEKITYLDLGTNIPDFGNNTFLFYNKDSNGVCVEADSDLIANIKKIRPKDIILNLGVGNGKYDVADFYVFNEASLNTFDRSEALERENQGTFNIARVDKVPLKTINNIIQENFSKYPDFLSIDIEGLDLEVLKTLNFKMFPIPVICAESCTYSENHIRPKNAEIIAFMLSQDYFIYADTYINTIFVNKAWFYN